MTTGFIIPLALTLQTASARYMRPDLVNIPVERLIKNLEKLSSKDPANVEARFNLARAHAMAYALKTETAEVWRGKEDSGVWFGYHPAHVPFSVTPTDDPAKLRAAKTHLAKALAQYSEVVRLAPENQGAALGYAWCLEKSGRTTDAIRNYRAIIRIAWVKEQQMTHADLGWHSVTAEAAGYLIPLLDKNAHREEIRTLQNRIRRMEMVPRPITPIVIPLRNGITAVDCENHSADVTFDADGTGLQKRWTWITRDAGWLVYDPNHAGKITSALQMFGSVTFWMFWENGYQALASLDDDGDGLLAGKELGGLAVWQDVNVNGISEPGEVKPVGHWGIVTISCRYLRDLSHRDQIAFSQAGVYFADGFHRPTFDVIMRSASSVD
jgi:hypothetical protein